MWKMRIRNVDHLINAIVKCCHDLPQEVINHRVDAFVSRIMKVVEVEEGQHTTFFVNFVVVLAFIVI